jgi:hypothetical protein
MELADDGTWIIDGEGVARQVKVATDAPLYRSHFASCAQASNWRRK